MRRYGGLARAVRSRPVVALAYGTCQDCKKQDPPGTGGMVGNCDRCGAGLCARCFFAHRCPVKVSEGQEVRT